VVDLREQGLVPILEPMDQIQLPERPGTIERTRGDPRHLLGELLLRRARRKRQLPDVEVEVEVGIVEPVRIVEAERDLHQPPAQGRQQRQALLHQGADVLEGELAARRGRGVEDGQPGDMARLVRALERQKLRVEAGQLTHRSILCG
jgi:hypothetical protein